MVWNKVGLDGFTATPKQFGVESDLWSEAKDQGDYR